MKALIIVLSLLLIFQTCGKKETAENNVNSKTENVEKSGKNESGIYTKFPGTNVEIKISKNFTQPPNFPGFKDVEKKSSIFITKIPYPYSATSKGFTNENLAIKGIKIEDSKSLQIDGLPGLLILGTQTAQSVVYIKHILTFGSEEETFVINGICPVDDKELGETIKNYLLTVRYLQEK